MKQSIVHVALVVRDYDEAIRFYIEKLNFTVGTVAVFQDLYGNLWDLLEWSPKHRFRNATSNRASR